MELALERSERQVAVPTPGGDAVLVDPRQHRAHVVRRLLCCGVSRATLLHLLPEWAELISKVDHELTAAGVRRAGSCRPR